MKGLSAAQNRLDQLTVQSRNALEAACRNAGRDIAREARRRAPVRTGRLRASIETEGEGVSWRVTAWAPYAVWVELGALRRPPRPFLLPAARLTSLKEKAEKALREVMRWPI